MDAIGIVYTYWATDDVNFYFTNILHGILGPAMRNRQNVMLFTANLWEELTGSLARIGDGRCDGMILIAPPVDNTTLDAFLERNSPFVLVGQSSVHPRISYVDIDNYQAARDATEYLMQLGHKRIALFQGEANQLSTLQRTAGYTDAVASSHGSPDQNLVFPGRYSPESGYERAVELLSWPKESRPTAIFCANDGIAFGTQRALLEAGVSIPREMSVMGFDDVSTAPLAPVSLTTVHQPFSNIGSRAAELLLDKIGGNRTVVKEELPTEIVVRGSTAPPAS